MRPASRDCTPERSAIPERTSVYITNTSRASPLTYTGLSRSRHLVLTQISAFRAPCRTIGPTAFAALSARKVLEMGTKKRIHREADYQPKQRTRMREAASRTPDSPEIPAEVVRHFDRSGPRYTSYPTADRFHPGFEERSYERQLAARATAENNSRLSLYVHLPFCRSLCYVCACNKVITHDHGCSARYESARVSRRPFCLSHAPMADPAS
ncbi:hypothetical protein B0G84_8952 [Paraburkholderia sp. BL8N3]|nr:hypothetical protein B0G84_8952 [Paraburkholderia sp. BL8N3]